MNKNRIGVLLCSLERYHPLNASKAGRPKASLPAEIPADGEWFVRIIGARNRLVYGVYRRHMKTIGHLTMIDELFGAPATTRSWSTILSVLRIVSSHEHQQLSQF